MSKQVKPFEVPICMGYLVWCQGEDFRAPEGMIFFEGVPKKGDKVILSDKKEWTVVSEQPTNEGEISVELL